MGDSRISYYALAILGGFILILIEKLVSLRFPKPPAEMLDRKREVQQATDSGDWYGDSDIDRLDRAMMRAEIERPGSTFYLYYHGPMAGVGRLIGSMMVSFILVGWILGVSPFSLRGILGLVFGSLILLYPYITWSISRPRNM